MYKGIYIAASGAVLKLKEMDVLTQNLANGDTIGYKKDTVSFSDYLIPQDATAGGPDGRAMSNLASFTTNFSNGNMIKTGNTLDVAIEGEGLIALEGGRYTKRGDLRKDRNGYLITHDGLKVLGKSGPIRLPEGVVEINEKGDILVNGAQVGTLKIRNFPGGKGLAKAGSGMFIASGEGVGSAAPLRQGFVEASNVEVVQEMVRMITTVREFETYQKVIQTFDEAAAKVNNDLGRM